MADEEKVLDYLKRVTVDLHDTRLRLEELEEQQREPLAIVGMSCRYPGGVRSAEDLWELVAAGADAIGDSPVDRGWTSEQIKGGFLYDAGEFDAGFFGISPREALAMDPQQRVLLEVSADALEHAGIPPSSLSGTQAGVFVGVMNQGYGSGEGTIPDDLTGYLVVGSSVSVVAGRVAYTFGLEGPAVAVDTACSSSLVALHLASQALRQGECSLALVGGVTVMANPGVFASFDRQGGLAPDGRCKSFADAANGASFSEGVGVVVVERLSEARRLGHEVMAVVRGSAVNQDGASNGLSAPNGPSQQRVIAQALRNARLSPDEVDVVEGHGTGTTLGDPIEAQALLAAYGQSRPDGHPLLLGSIKSNIGHTQAAAGVAGVIKMAMAMRHGVLPATLHVDRPSRQVDWSTGAVSLLTEAVPWQANGRPRRAAVSSFGVSGTNAHVVLEESPPGASVEVEDGALSGGEDGALSGGVVPWVISARSASALGGQAQRLLEHVADDAQLDAADVGFSLVSRRSLYEHRAVVLGAGREDLLPGLAGLAAGDSVAGVVRGVAGTGGKVAYLFTGQGAQHAGMGRELYEAFPVFAGALDEVCEQLDVHLGRSLRDVIFAREGSVDAELLDQTMFTQAGLFALEVALFRLLDSWGARPHFVMGHSIGELAAAHVAGVFSLFDACSLVAARGRLMQALPAGGAMVSVQASEEEILPTLAGYEGRVALAAVNGPAATVLSGDEDAVLELASAWKERGRKTKRLRVSHAFHSPRMDGMLDEFARVAEGVSFSAPRIPLVSNLTGAVLSEELVCTAEYWVRHVREPVRFLAGMRWLQAQGVRSFLELGPDGVLSAMGQECLTGAEVGADGDAAVLVPVLRGDQRPQVQALITALAELFVRGASLDWEALFAGSERRRVPLPGYAFQRDHYWLVAPAAGAANIASAGLGAADHPLLATATGLANDQGWLFSGRLSLATHPWLADHAVMGTTLLPGAAFVELALRAGRQVGCGRLRTLTLEVPLVLPVEGGVQLQMSVGEPGPTGERPLSISSRSQGIVGEEPGDEQTWTLHARGLLAPMESSVGSSGSSVGEAQAALLGGDAWPPLDAEVVAVDDIYGHMVELGFDHGPAFQGLRSAWRRGDELFAEVSLPKDQHAQAALFDIHPALLDSALHALGVGLLDAPEDAGEQDGVRIPFSWEGVELHSTGASSLRVHLSSVRGDEMSVVMADEHGELVASVRSLTLRTVSSKDLGNARRGHHRSLFCLDWRSVSVTPAKIMRRLALLDPEGRLPVEALRSSGVEVQAHTDLAVLGDAVREGARLPDAVLTGCALDRDGAASGLALNGADGPDSGGMAEAVHSVTHRVLALVQAWLADERLARSRLVVLTRGALAAGAEEDVPDLAGAAVWGLVRSAQSENPGRLVLVDLDGHEASWVALAGALATDEPQLAIREGAVSAPRLARGDAAGKDAGAFAPDGTVLVTGGTGGLGSLVARHLVRHHGVRSLLLLSRRGRAAEGAPELEAELGELGAHVEIVACDVSDREQLAQLIAATSSERPLKAVVHTAGVIDDGVIGALTPERLDRVMAPKAIAAHHLHQLTEHMDLTAFILFSSIAATFGGVGQGNYAAANAFLDALAAHRRARGLAGVSLAWGPWAQATGMTGDLDQATFTRMARVGIGALSSEEGMELFDVAQASAQALSIPVRLDIAALRATAKAGGSPALLRELVRLPAQAPGDGAGGSLALRLAAVPEAERDAVVLELVRSEVATVLGHTSSHQVDGQRAFKDLGFDSLTAVELRNRLDVATGLQLPATLVFDHPTPTALARHLLDEVAGTNGQAPLAVSVLATDEPIAIVGMACRYPGDVRSPQELWELVAAGRDGISPFPVNRGWDIEELYDPDPDRPGKSYAREGGFLHDAAEFDPGFFGIGPSEALGMDPQQRLLLEVAWEAIEDADIDPSALRGSATGVFAGLMYHDYALGLGLGATGMETYLSAGKSGSILSGRVAYCLGLEGPAMTVDTACSSSLVTLHLACQALRQGECSMALAGGVAVMSTPGAFLVSSRQRALAPDGRCKSFADTADGVGWSEGVGMVLVERLSDALRLGHEVLALVRGSAVNQDGASNGLTAPNGPSQQRVIAHALASGRLSADEIDAVEGHGTGTMLGDPIEAQALLATYGRGRSPENPLWLGSLKSNIGHAQAAAGVASVIKMVMAMRHGVLPRTLHVDQPSRQVDWSSGAVSLLTEDVPWTRNGRPRRAGVSSFGVSGTNAHVIIEEPPVALSRAAPADSPAPGKLVPWVISGNGPGGLRGQAGRLLEHLEAHPEAAVGDIGYALAATRSRFARRAVVLGDSRQELLDGLGALADATPTANVIEGAAADGGVAFLFPGQGSQWMGMALELLDASPIFAEAMAECGEALAPHVDWSLQGVLRGEEGAPGLDVLDVVQPVLFALLVSLARVWRAHGVRPAAVMGHSQGEIAAAHVAGGLSLPDAARLVALRSQVFTRLAQELATRGEKASGGMASVSIGAEPLRPRLERWEGRLVIAAINGPASVVVSGERQALTELLEECESEGVRTRAVPAAVGAGHSPAVDEIRAELLEVGASVTPRSGEVPFYSTVTGGLLDTAELDAHYWYRNARQTVLFEPVTRALLEQGYRTFIEVSPHPVLRVPVQETIDSAIARPQDAAIIGSLRREQGGPRRFFASLAEAWVRGVDVDWRKVFAEDPGRQRVKLPTYAFQRESYWLESALPGAGDLASVGLSDADHPLLGVALALADERGWLFTNRLSLSSHPWLADHAAMGTALLPGTAFLELALCAGRQVGCENVRELLLEAPLLLPEEGALKVQVLVGELETAGTRSLSVYSRSEDRAGDELGGEGEWTRHATGVLSLDGQQPEPEDALTVDMTWPPPDAQAIDVEDLYDRMAERGYDYGPAFQGMRAAWRRGEQLFAEVVLPEDLQAQAGLFGVHPALLDAALHVMGVGLLDGQADGEADGRADGEADGQADGEAESRALLPFLWSSVSLRTAGASSLRVRISPAGVDAVSIALADGSGTPVAAVRSLALRATSPADLAGLRAGQESLFHLNWAKTPTEAPARQGSRKWAALGDWLAGSLREAGVQASSHADLDALAEALDGGLSLPDVVLVSAPAADRAAAEDGDASLAARASCHGLLSVIQRWLADERFASARLVVLSSGAVSVLEGEDVPGLSQASVWGLVRVAQAENPGRLVLLDTDAEQSSWAALPGILALDEPQLAVRMGDAFIPRLARAARPVEGAPVSGTPASVWDPQGTVLITGGTGALGTLVARHLVDAHGVRSLLLASRRGLEAPGAATLAAELRELGAKVSIVSCDVADRRQLAALLDEVPEDYPLRGVVHTAATLDDGVVASWSAEGVDRVFAPKADAAWHLHALTAHLPLSAFVLFSSAAGTLGNPGQGIYAAANVFLDALAAHRRANGLAAVSLAWGLWAATSSLSDADMQRLQRSGAVAMPAEEGLRLLDAACAADAALAIPTRFDIPALRAAARAWALPPLLRGLVRMPSRAAQDAGSLTRRLAETAAAQRHDVVLETVRAEAAAVLGSSPAEVQPQTPFLELGFDSLTVVELRNRLNAASGLQLPVALALDCPTPAALADYLLNRLTSDGEVGAGGEHPSTPATSENAIPPAKESDTISALLLRANDLGMIDDFLASLLTLSQFRPTFDTKLEPDQAPKPVRLAEGPAVPRLICLPPILATSGPHQYIAFARAFGEERDILVLPQPGFLDGEMLPATVQLAIETQAQAVSRCDTEVPFVLVGHSTGGMSAHAVASHLEGLGIMPAAIVLLDTYMQDKIALNMRQLVMGRMLEGRASDAYINDARMTAMAAYLRLYANWQPQPVAAPTLLVRASQAMPGALADGDWQTSWPFDHVTADVPGDHFTMIEEHVHSTVQVVRNWLTGELGEMDSE